MRWVGAGLVCAGLAAASSTDGLAGLQLIVRPLDAPSERLERPRPEQEGTGSSEAKARLSYGEVIGLAKTAAKKELGKRFADYDVKAALFDPGSARWSVFFDPKLPRRPSGGCLIVFVHDKDKTTDLQPCH